MGQGERSYPQSRLMCITLDALHTIAARVYNYVGTDVPMRYAAPAQLATLAGLRTPRDESPLPLVNKWGAARAGLPALP